MHIITRKRLNEFAEKHPTAMSGLTVFNIGGNKARLVAAIHYNRRKVYIRAVLTHAEYDTGKWKAN